MATSWLPEEEERAEPSPLVLQLKYYDYLFNQADAKEKKLSLDKVALERKVSREMAEVAGFRNDLESKRAKGDALAEQEGQNEGDPAIIKQQIELEKEKDKDTERIEQEMAKVIKENDKRDADVSQQQEVLDLRERYKRGKAAVEENIKRRAKERNKIPGVVAVDPAGLEITTAAECKAEAMRGSKVDFQSGQCKVVGDEIGFDKPAELGLASQISKSEEQFEASRARTQTAKQDLKAAESDAKVADTALHKAERSKTKGVKQEKQVEKLQAEATQRHKEEAELRQKMLASKAEAKQALQEERESLNKLAKYENSQEKRDAKDAAREERRSKGARAQVERSEEHQGNIELHEADSLKRRTKELAKEVADVDDETEAQGLKAQETHLERMTDEAQRESEALHKHKEGKATDLQAEQRNAAARATEKERLSLADAASRGQGGQALTTNAALHKMDEEIANATHKLVKEQEKEAGQVTQERDSLGRLADVETKENAAALKKAQAQQKLQRARREAEALLGVQAFGWPQWRSWRGPSAGVAAICSVRVHKASLPLSLVASFL